MTKEIRNPKSEIRNLGIEVSGSWSVVSWGGYSKRVELRKRPILVGIEKVVGDPGAMNGIEVKLENATFSTVRQVVTAVNTLAWVLGVKVNGVKQIKASYSAKPNITKPLREK